jgi:hypothetical protein
MTKSQEKFKFSHDLDLESIKSHIDNLVTSSKEVQSSFSALLIQFVNENNECYWLIPATNAYVSEWQGKSDDGLFSADEDYNDSKSFFETIMNSFYDLKNNSTQGMIDLIDDKFYHLCCTVLYCTISEECRNDIRVNELTNLLLLINFEDLPELNDRIIGGDLSWDILGRVIESFCFDIKDFCDEGNLWRDTYLMNYEELAQTFLDNDVFDNDWY